MTKLRCDVAVSNEQRRLVHGIDCTICGHQLGRTYQVCKCAIEVQNRHNFITYTNMCVAGPRNDTRRSYCTLPTTRELSTKRARIGLGAKALTHPAHRLWSVVAGPNDHCVFSYTCAVESVEDPASAMLNIIAQVILQEWTDTEL